VDDSRTYFDPLTLAKLAGLDLKARRIVEGYVSGLHRSPYAGFSVEFAEHREYAPGDDVRYLDWKVFGKTDRFYLKRFEEETNFACHLLLDASESMRYQSAAAAFSKLEYAKLVAAAVGYLVVHQQDAVGLATFDKSLTRWLAPSSRAAQLKQLVHVLEQTQPQGETAIGPILHEAAERIQRRGVVLILSDLFDDPKSVISGLKHFRHSRHDVTVLHVIDPAEQDFPFDDATRFRGLEGLPSQSVDPRTLKRAYQAEFEAFLREIGRGCRDLQIDHVLLRTDRPLDVALRSFLIQRTQRAGRN
jgi:uncharacterized protein (DUF58 family)